VIRQAISELEDNHKERPDIHDWRIFFALMLVNLRCKIEFCTAKCGQIFTCSGETEVNLDRGLVSTLDENICWLDVSMYYWFFASMKICQS